MLVAVFKNQKSHMDVWILLHARRGYSLQKHPPVSPRPSSPPLAVKPCAPYYAESAPKLRVRKIPRGNL